jgi:glyoxylase-like metal-dependent hydrolase (beta-lactamase superfamily II)
LQRDKGTLNPLVGKSFRVRSPDLKRKGAELILESVVAPYFETNCWIFAPTRNSECFIVDPGIANPNLLSSIIDVLRKYNLKPISILVTHGHLDHTFTVLPLAKEYGIPTYIHSTDRKLLADPFKALQAGGMSAQIMEQLGVTDFAEPEDVREVSDSFSFEVAGFDIKVDHAPGHTAGSALFTVNDEYLISGDVLFAGAIGRTDMPTGSASAMRDSLKGKILPMPDELIVLPGHGPQTTIGRERKVNPYLQADFLSSAPRKGE